MITKDKNIGQIQQWHIDENYEVIKNEIQRAICLNKEYIFVVKPGYTETYGKYMHILEPVVEMIKNDGFIITNDFDNPYYLKIFCK